MQSSLFSHLRGETALAARILYRIDELVVVQFEIFVR